MRFVKPTNHEIHAAALLVVFGLLTLVSVRNKTATWDEPDHFAYGANLLRYHGQVPASLSRMAISQVNAEFCRLCRCPTRLPKRGHCLFAARIPTIFLGILLGAVIFSFARRLYGPQAALASLLLYTFSPTVLAHSRWVTNDIAVTLFFTTTLYAFLRYKETDRLSHLVLAAFFFGMAQASKFTAFFLAPSLLIVQLMQVRTRTALAEMLSRRSMGRLLLFVTLAWFTLNAMYWFAGTFDTWQSLHLRSSTMMRIQRIAGSLPTLLPRSYIEAFDTTFFLNATDSGRGYLVLLGRISRHPFPGYFLYALLYKVPLGTLVLVTAALITSIFHHRNNQGSERLLAVPAGLLSVYFLFFCGAQIGVRYLLPLIALGQVFAGRLWMQPSERAEKMAGAVDGKGGISNWIRTWAKRAALAAAVVSTLSFFPDFLSYFNVLAADRTKTYRILADSNLDWGQNDWIALQKMKKMALSERQLSPLHPRPGTWVVPGSDLAGVRDPTRYRWLRPLDAAAAIAHSHFLFHVTGDDIVDSLEVKGPFPHLPPSTPSRAGIERSEFPNRTISGRPCRRTLTHWIHSPQTMCGKRDDFSFRLETWLWIPRTGHYLLGLGSDDGSRLFLSGRLLIDLWSIHDIRWDHVVVRLEPGLYPLRIDYFEQTGGATLRFYGRDIDNHRTLSQSAFRLAQMVK